MTTIVGLNVVPKTTDIEQERSLRVAMVSGGHHEIWYTAVVDYDFDGGTYSIDIMARSEEEALARVEAIRSTARFAHFPCGRIPGEFGAPSDAATDCPNLHLIHDVTGDPR